VEEISSSSSFLLPAALASSSLFFFLLFSSFFFLLPSSIGSTFAISFPFSFSPVFPLPKKTFEFFFVFYILLFSSLLSPPSLPLPPAPLIHAPAEHAPELLQPRRRAGAKPLGAPLHQQRDRRPPRLFICQVARHPALDFCQFFFE